MDDPTRRRCTTCVYWRVGICKRYPPQLVMWPNDNQHPVLYSPTEVLPSTKADDFCGEHTTAGEDRKGFYRGMAAQQPGGA